MPTFLSDPPPAVYLVLIGAVLVTGVIFARYQDRKRLRPLGVALALLGLVYLIDRIFESPREEATRKVEAMAEAATAADPTRFVESVSPSFQYHGADREKLKASGAWHLIRSNNARIAVWDFSRAAFEQISDTELEIGFYAKAQAPGRGALVRYIKARFVKDPDGQWRVKTFGFYNPAEHGLNQEEPIPGFP
jgi:hypothetical protein